MNATTLLAAWREQVNSRLPEEAGDTAAVHVVELSPLEFLVLTGWTALRPVSDMLEQERMRKWQELPCLTLFEDGAVWGHEGRHRVAAAWASGLSAVPIVVWLFQRSAVETGNLEALNSWTSRMQPLPRRPWSAQVGGYADQA